jgi:hypothetical protein
MTLGGTTLLMGAFKHHSKYPKERSIQNYLFPHVCFHCRKSFKKPKSLEPPLCPQCAGATVMLSRKFSAPKAIDTEQWRKVEFLVAHGFLFQSVYEQSEGGGRHKVAYPSTLIEAEAFVVEYRMQAVRG